MGELSGTIIRLVNAKREAMEQVSTKQLIRNALVDVLRAHARREAY